jgi:hypothetical protein
MSLTQKLMPFAVLSIFATVGASVVACGDDDTTATPTTDAGATDSGAVDSGPATDAGTDAAPVQTTWEKLGATDAARYTAVQGLVGKIVTAELADTAIAPYFGAGRLKITADQLGECLSQQVATVLGAPAATATYPATVFKGVAGKEYACRDMKTSHAGQGISDSIYTKFLTNAVTVVKTNIADPLGSEIVSKLAPVLTGSVKTDIVDNKVCTTDADCTGSANHKTMTCTADTAPATTKSCQVVNKT